MLFSFTHWILFELLSLISFILSGGMYFNFTTSNNSLALSIHTVPIASKKSSLHDLFISKAKFCPGFHLPNHSGQKQGCKDHNSALRAHPTAELGLTSCHGWRAPLLPRVPVLALTGIEIWHVLQWNFLVMHKAVLPSELVCRLACSLPASSQPRRRAAVCGSDKRSNAWSK